MWKNIRIKVNNFLFAFYQTLEWNSAEWNIKQSFTQMNKDGAMWHKMEAVQEKLIRYLLNVVYTRKNERSFRNMSTSEQKFLQGNSVLLPYQMQSSSLDLREVGGILFFSIVCYMIQNWDFMFENQISIYSIQLQCFSFLYYCL